MTTAVFGQCSQWVSQNKSGDKGSERKVFEVSHVSFSRKLRKESLNNHVCDYFPHMAASIGLIFGP